MTSFEVKRGRERVKAKNHSTFGSCEFFFVSFSTWEMGNVRSSNSNQRSERISLLLLPPHQPITIIIPIPIILPFSTHFCYLFKSSRESISLTVSSLFYHFNWVWCTVSMYFLPEGHILSRWWWNASKISSISPA